MSYSQEILSLLEKGSRAYAAKEYEKAVESYGEACQEYSSTHTGEEDPELLFLYGKTLFKVAVDRNGLFGGNSDEAAAIAGTSTDADGSGLDQVNDDIEEVPLAEEVDEDESEDESGDKDGSEVEAGQQKPVEEEGEEGEDDEKDESSSNGSKEQSSEEQQDTSEQSDFEIAWEILDLARSLYEQKLASVSSKSDEKEEEEVPENPSESKDPKVIARSRLSDIYDLLGEISLETENFKQSVEDFGTLLKYREQLFPFDSNLISEAHYKLSLALEFNFDDPESKEKSINHLQKAIESLESNKQRKITSNEKFDEALIEDLRVKLQELQKDPNEAFLEQKQEILKGLLGEATASDSKHSTPTNVQVNDLSSVVKKRKAKPNDANSKKPKK